MKKSLVVVLSVSLLVLTVSGLSYSYFKGGGIANEEHLSVVAKNLAVIFTDDSKLTGEIYPGYEETKTFSVENKSESLFKYDIIFEDLVNTFKTEGFLQYRITSNDGGFNCDWTDVPKSNEPTDTILAYSIEIENGKKHNYTLEIRYQNSETVDQSDDMGKVLSGNLAIKEGTKNPKLKQVTLNVENGTPETTIIEVLENENATFEVEPNEEYKTKGAKLTCDNEYSTTIDEETTSVTIPNITKDTICTLKMKLKVPKFIAKLKEDNKNITTRNSFNSAFSVAGLYVENDPRFLEEDGKTEDVVYYFAGNPDNNWVKFGKDGSDDIWWRIIRTNEDGSVRLLYAGKGASGHNSTTGYIKSSQAYNGSYNNAKYVGYMYGETGDTLEDNRKNDTNSPIKKIIDDWYDTNIIQTDGQYQYGTYLSRTAIYCNDRSTHNYVATSYMYYGAAMRLTTEASHTTYGGVSNESEYHPTFKCGGNAYGTGLWDNADTADKFSGKNSQGVGNQALKDKPIALMTADEISYAGGIYGSDSENTYYYRNSSGKSVTNSMWWWTMSSHLFYVGRTRVFNIGGSDYPGRLSGGGVDNLNAVRPVLSLKSCVEVTGSGKVDDPYIPSIDDACANADN